MKFLVVSHVHVKSILATHVYCPQVQHAEKILVTTKPIDRRKCRQNLLVLCACDHFKPASSTGRGLLSCSRDRSIYVSVYVNMSLDEISQKVFKNQL